MTDCIFCKIIAREIAAEVVYEDEKTFAFLDIRPLHLGHTLVLPKKHFINIYEMEEKYVEDVAKTSQKIARALKEKLKVDGVNVIMNNDTAAGQVVFHAHVHILPRFTDDGFKHWPGKQRDPEKQKETAKKIREALS